MSKPGKKPKQSSFPPGRTVRIGGDPDSYQREPPVWKIDIFDVEGPWGKCGLDPAHVWADIVPKLKNFESMKWSDIVARKDLNHSVSIDSLTKEAKDRVLKLRLDVSELFRFRLTGKQRLWGIRDRNIFRILWWDPEHLICPSTLRNT